MSSHLDCHSSTMLSYLWFGQGDIKFREAKSAINLNHINQSPTDSLTTGFFPPNHATIEWIQNGTLTRIQPHLCIITH